MSADDSYSVAENEIDDSRSQTGFGGNNNNNNRGGYSSPASDPLNGDYASPLPVQNGGGNGQQRPFGVASSSANAIDDGYNGPSNNVDDSYDDYEYYNNDYNTNNNEDAQASSDSYGGPTEDLAVDGGVQGVDGNYGGPVGDGGLDTAASSSYGAPPSSSYEVTLF